MITRSVKCTIVNTTGDSLALDADGTNTNGVWGPAPPAQCGPQADFMCQASGTPDGARGQASYTGPNGTLVVSFTNPLEGDNTYSAVATGTYAAGYNAAMGRDATVTFNLDKKADGDSNELPTAVDKDPGAADYDITPLDRKSVV